MSASIANVTDGHSPFQLNLYMRLQSASPAYIAVDSIHLVDCYQGDTILSCCFAITAVLRYVGYL